MRWVDGHGGMSLMSLSALESQRKTHTEHFLHSDFHYDFGKCPSPLRPLTEVCCVHPIHHWPPISVSGNLKNPWTMRSVQTRDLRALGRDGKWLVVWKDRAWAQGRNRNEGSIWKRKQVVGCKVERTAQSTFSWTAGPKVCVDFNTGDTHRGAVLASHQKIQVQTLALLWTSLNSGFLFFRVRKGWQCHLLHRLPGKTRWDSLSWNTSPAPWYRYLGDSNLKLQPICIQFAHAK